MRLRWKAIWCLIWHRHQKFNGPVRVGRAQKRMVKPSAYCRRCGMYFRWPVQ